MSEILEQRTVAFLRMSRAPNITHRDMVELCDSHEALRRGRDAAHERLEQVREKLPQMMKAVCAGCNNGVRMNSYNKHENGFDCEAVRYRDVLAILKGEVRG